jgi:hypothetical protein
VCRSPDDVKRYLDYRFRVKKGFPVHESEGEEKAKLEARATAAAAKTKNADTQWGSGPYTKYQLELSFFKLKALGPAKRVKGPKKRQSIEAAEQKRDKATEAQPQNTAKNPAMLRKEMEEKDWVMVNLLVQPATMNFKQSLTKYLTSSLRNRGGPKRECGWRRKHKRICKGRSNPLPQSLERLMIGKKKRRGHWGTHRNTYRQTEDF